MHENVKLDFFKIHNCGYYEFNKPEPKFGSLNEILTDIEKWGEHQSIINTKLYDPANENLPVYLFNAIKSKKNNDWLLIMWNEVPSTESGVASIMGNSTISSPKIVENEIKEGSIPGFPTYFWFIPDEGMFASVRFRNRLNTGQGAMRAYIESALEKISSYTHFDSENQILGFAPKDKEPEKLTARFRTFRAKRQGDRDLIIDNSLRINKIYCKDTLKQKIEIDRNFFQILLDKNKLSISDKTSENSYIKIKYEFSPPQRLTKKNVKEIIKEWDKNKQNGWNDYGFSFEKDSKTIHWLSKTILKADADLDIIWQNSEIVEPYWLLSQLRENRDYILKQIKL